MRQDRLAHADDERRWRSQVSQLPADEMYKVGNPPVSGAQVAGAYGFLAHYTTLIRLEQMLQARQIGGGAGCWLTPTIFAACMAPYDLGLDTPRNVCLLIDVSALDNLWGPGTAGPSRAYSAIWRGGAVEFYFPGPIAVDLVRRVYMVEPCGDRL